MENFVNHHRHLIHDYYEIFDRIVLRAYIPGLCKEGGLRNIVFGLENTTQLTKEILAKRTNQYHQWVQSFTRNNHIPILWAPKNRRKEEVVFPYYRYFKKECGVVCILQSMESFPTYILTTPKYPTEDPNYKIIHKVKKRVKCYYFYIKDPLMGNCCFRICSYYPFSATIYLNGHQWLERQLKRNNISYKKTDNCFIQINDFAKAREIIKQFNNNLLYQFCNRWIYKLVPVFSMSQRERYNLYYWYSIAQIEYCNNLIFKRTKPLSALFERMLDLGRTLGRPDIISNFFGYHITKKYKGKLQTTIDNRHNAHPVIKSWYKKSFIKQYEKEGRVLRTECCLNDPKDLKIGRDLKQLEKIKKHLSDANHRYLDYQKDILLSLVDRGGLNRLAETTVVENRRIPGIKLENRRLMVLMEVVQKVSHFLGGFTCGSLRDEALKRQKLFPQKYSLSQVRYDLSKLRAKGLVEKKPGKNIYSLTRVGQVTCVLLTKLRDKIFGPLISSALMDEIRQSGHRLNFSRSSFDYFYHNILTSIDDLLHFAGIVVTAT